MHKKEMVRNRQKRRFLVEFELAGERCTGFTYDISPTGLFVRASRMPKLGQSVKAAIHIPGGREIAVTGKVARIFRAGGALSRVVPSGFALQVSGQSEDYLRFVSALEAASRPDPGTDLAQRSS